MRARPDQELIKPIDRHRNWRESFAHQYRWHIAFGGPLAAALPFLLRALEKGPNYFHDPSALPAVIASLVAGVVGSFALGSGLIVRQAIQERKELRESQSKMPIPIGAERAEQIDLDSLTLPIPAGNEPMSRDRATRLRAALDRRISEAQRIMDDISAELERIDQEIKPSRELYERKAITRGELERRSFELWAKGEPLRRRREKVWGQLTKLYEWSQRLWQFEDADDTSIGQLSSADRRSNLPLPTNEPERLDDNQ